SIAPELSRPVVSYIGLGVRGYFHACEMATWRSGYAADCKSAYPGSIPGVASTHPNFRSGALAFGGRRRQPRRRAPGENRNHAGEGAADRREEFAGDGVRVGVGRRDAEVQLLAFL